MLKDLGSNDEGSLVNWDSYNIVDVSFEDHQINYKLETIILLELGIQEAGTNLTSYMTKSVNLIFISRIVR